MTSLLIDDTTTERGRQAQLRDAWGGFLTDLGDRNGRWDWWFTGTFRDKASPEAPYWTKPGWSYTGKAWDKFIVELGLRKGLHDVRWVRGREYQHWRGVPHFHGLIGGVAGLRRDGAWAWWFKEYGIARIEPYDPQLGAGFYLCKYVTKELGDIQFSAGMSLKY